MVTIDLNLEQRWDDLFRRVEAGEILRVVRGDREIAIVQPSELVAEDERLLRHLAELAERQMAQSFPANEFADWEQGHGAR